MPESLLALQNVVGGHAGPARAGRTREVLDPSTGEVYATAPESDDGDVDDAVRAATAAFETWRETTPSERQRALLRIADALEDHADELVAIECRDTGKPPALTASEEIPPMLDQVRFFAGAARLLEGRSAGEYMAGFTSYVRREPLGAVGAVTPWNYPMMMAVWKWAPALAAGNTLVLKPAETTPASTLRMAEIMGEHLPDGVLNVVCGGRETGRALVADRRLAMVAITGSVRAGREVAAAAAGNLARVHLELGGKAPAVVFADADLDAAAEGIGVGGWFNAGQDCTAATRVLVDAAVHDELVALLRERAGAQVVGGPDVAGADLGPLNSAAQLERVTGFLERVPAHAEVVAGGARHGDRGYFFAPTVVAGLRQDDELVQQEVFGPVVGVQPFRTEDEALALANGVEYGLAASVWTRDHGRALRATRAIDAGCVWVNCHLPLVAEMPHGGVKSSGYGKDLSVYGLEDYTRLKHVMSALT